MTVTDKHRHNVSMPPELWQRVKQAAADEGAKQGRPMSISAWLRSLVLAKLGR